MVAKNVIGRSYKGCLVYLISKVEKGQGEILEVRNVRETKNEMISDFNMSRHYNEKLTKCVWHTSLSFDKEDRLTDQQMLEIAKEWMKGMDLYDTQWAIVKHTDTCHQHLHIVANRIADDGHTISDSNNYKRSEKICRQLEKKYNLKQVPSVRNEQEINHEKLKGRDHFKSECHLAIQDALKRAKSTEEFNTLMKKEKNIECVWKYNPDGSPRGLTFMRDEMKLKGSDINRLYSARGITNYIDYKNQRRVITQAKQATSAVKDSSYHLKHTLAKQNHHNPDDDLIAIDKVLGMDKKQKLKLF